MRSGQLAICTPLRANPPVLRPLSRKSGLVFGTAYARHTICISLTVLSKSGAIKMFYALLSISFCGFLSSFPSQGEDCLAATWLPGQSSPWDVWTLGPSSYYICLGRGVDMAAATTPGAHSSPHTFQILVLLSSRMYFVILIFLHNFKCISVILYFPPYIFT